MISIAQLTSSSLSKFSCSSHVQGGNNLSSISFITSSVKYVHKKYLAMRFSPSSGIISIPLNHDFLSSKLAHQSRFYRNHVQSGPESRLPPVFVLIWNASLPVRI